MDGAVGLAASEVTDSGSVEAVPSGPVKLAYPTPAPLPTQLGPEGIRFDFNHGARLALPQRSVGQWRVCLRDLGTGNILFQSDNQGALILSSKRWFIRFRLEVWSVGDDAEAAPVFTHDYDNAGQTVLIQLPVGTLGDVLAWFPYCRALRRGASALPGGVRHVRPDHPVAGRDLSRHPPRHA